MTVYCCYTGRDLKSYLAVLEPVQMGDYAARTKGEPVLGQMVHTYGLRTSNRPPGSWQDFHPSTNWGSITFVLDGALEIGVSAGKLRKCVLKKGDACVLLDTTGDGHTAARVGKRRYKGINVRLSPNSNVTQAFKGWPKNLRFPSDVPAIVGDPNRRAT